MDIHPLSHAIGAEITGLDLNAPLNRDTIAAIRPAWLDHNVLLFRNQDLTPENHIAFSRQFGTLDDHRSRPDEQLPGYPEIFMVTNHPRDDGRPSRTRNTGRQWHTDFPTHSALPWDRYSIVMKYQKRAATLCSPT